jgi:hypothetical protein
MFTASCKEKSNQSSPPLKASPTNLFALLVGMSIANVSVQVLSALEPLRTHAAAKLLMIQLNMQLAVGFGLEDVTAERALELGMTESG